MGFAGTPHLLMLFKRALTRRVSRLILGLSVEHRGTCGDYAIKLDSKYKGIFTYLQSYQGSFLG